MKIFIPILTICMIVLSSCNEEWDNHYKNELDSSSNQRIDEYIKGQENLSIFYNLLKRTGYDKVLNNSQTYTVWAPVNDAFIGVDTTDMDWVDKMVKNHISRYAIATTGITSRRVSLLGGKKAFFENEKGSYTFGDIELEKSDHSLLNGVVHEIPVLFDYQENIYETLASYEGLDSLKEYIYSNTKRTFDVNSSTQVGIDEITGVVTYDSNFVITNQILNYIGQFESEDSLYTVFLPNNNAWNKGYDTIKTFYNVFGDRGEEVQKAFTSFEIIKNSTFSGLYENADGVDSLTSTIGTVFYKPMISENETDINELDYLFSDNTLKKVSNGFAFISNSFKMPAQKGWFKEIRIEAETTSGRNPINSEIIRRSGLGYDLDISGYNKRFIEVTSTATSLWSKSYVDFTIPKNLSAKYNIYVMFVPSWVATGKKYFSEADFFINYMKEDGTMYDPSNNKTKYLSLPVSENSTDTLTMTKMLVAEGFEFPYCHMDLDREPMLVEDYEGIFNQDHSVVLRIQNPITKENRDEEGTYIKSMYIDCIILEPVE